MAMAVITLHPAIQSVQGKLGDIVFVRRKNTQFVRKYVVPRDPRTAAQRKNRRAFADCVALWRQLPRSFRDSWNRYGRAENRTGYNLFISENMRAMRLGRAPLPVKVKHLKEHCGCIAGTLEAGLIRLRSRLQAITGAPGPGNGKNPPGERGRLCVQKE